MYIFIHDSIYLISKYNEKKTIISLSVKKSKRNKTALITICYEQFFDWNKLKKVFQKIWSQSEALNVFRNIIGTEEI